MILNYNITKYIPLFQSDLTQQQLEELDKIYKDVYVKKYPIVGYMEYLVKEKRKKLDL